MRKSNISKILVAILAFSLVLGAVIGITAAADEAESTVYLENSQIERNVEYESKTYLLYRVAKSAINDGDEAGLYLQISDVNGNTVGAVTPEEDGNYYVFKTQGIPAKELNTKEVVTLMSGDKAISNAITWSVEEYLYARLYADGYADVTEGGVAKVGVNDGKDHQRRALYYDLLKVGVNAQNVLAPDAADKIGDSAFVFAEDALATYGRFDEPTKITLRYDDSKTPAGEKFLGWEYAMYDSFGDLIKEGAAADCSVITAEGYLKAKPVYESDYYTHSYIDFAEDNYADYVQGSAAEGYATASVVDGKFVLDQHTSGKNNYWYVAPNTKLADADAVVFEADFSVNITKNSEVGYLSLFTGSKATGYKVYWAYLLKSGDYVMIDREFVVNSGTQTYERIYVKTPIKVDGTSCKLRIVYRETEWGEDYLEFYADGELFHTTNRLYATGYNDNKQGPDATSINCVTMNFPSGATGTMTLDNVAMTQCILPKFERLGLDEAVIDFDGNTKDVTRGNVPTADNYYSDVFDEKTGNGYLLLTKKDDTHGITFDVPVTYTESGADYAVLSFDYYMEDSVTNMSSQIYAAHKYSNGFANGETPLLPQFGAPDGHKGKWIHVEITYEAIEFANDGTVSKIEHKATVTDGPQMTVLYDANTGVYKNGATKFKIFNEANTMEVPTAADLTGFRISLNQKACGDVRFDNVSFKLINKAGN